MTRKIVALTMIVVLMGLSATAFAAPIPSQSDVQNTDMEKGGLQSSSTLDASQIGQNQENIEALPVGQVSDEALWVILGVAVLIAIVVIAA